MLKKSMDFCDKKSLYFVGKIKKILAKHKIYEKVRGKEIKGIGGPFNKEV